MHPNLDRTATENLCKVDGCQLVSVAKIELIILDKKIKSAKSLEQLEKHWNQFKGRNIPPDAENVSTYLQKKAELEKADQTAAKAAAAG